MKVPAYSEAKAKGLLCDRQAVSLLDQLKTFESAQIPISISMLSFLKKIQGFIKELHNISLCHLHSIPAARVKSDKGRVHNKSGKVWSFAKKNLCAIVLDATSSPLKVMMLTPDVG